MRNLQSSIDARDLNSVRTFESIFGHEHRSLHPLASSRSRALADAGSLGRSLPCGEPGATFGMSAATYRHGLCPTDMAQGIAQHRHVFERQVRSTPSFGAGEGNRTLVSSLGSWRSAIELHPRGICQSQEVTARRFCWLALLPGGAFQTATFFRSGLVVVSQGVPAPAERMVLS